MLNIGNMTGVLAFFNRYKWLVSIAVAVLYCVITLYKMSFLGWILWSPLFALLLNKKNTKSNFKLGFVFGTALGLCVLQWTWSSISSYTGGSLILPVLFYLIGCGFMGLYYGLIFGLATWIKSKTYKEHPYLDGLLFFLVIFFGEIVFEKLCIGYPYLIAYYGYTVVANLHVLQWVSWGGMYIVSAFVIATNILVAYSFRYYKKVVPIVIIFVVSIYSLGYYIRIDFEQNNIVTRRLNVGIVCENTSPETKWSDANANTLVQQLINTLDRTIALNPDIILWTESAVPWTYDPQDDFIKLIGNKISNSSIEHVIGINTSVNDSLVMNSAYVIGGNGECKDRYDKVALLSLVEAPFMGINLPFMESSFNAQSGKEIKPLKTQHGLVGTMICNESNVTRIAQNMVTSGAEYLLTMSNDGWFSESKVVTYFHFLQSRIRAVEQRKDLIVNSNLGYCGKIKASGIVEQKTNLQKVYTQVFQIECNRSLTIYNKYYQ